MSEIDARLAAIEETLATSQAALAEMLRVIKMIGDTVQREGMAGMIASIPALMKLVKS